MQTHVCQSAQFVTDPLGEPQPVQLFLHNFSYARITWQLHNEACSCTQDRLEIIVDVHRLIRKYTVTVIQSTVNHGSHKSMCRFLAQGVTNKTKLTDMKITVSYRGANVCRHGQVTVDDDTQISDVRRRSDPCPAIRSGPIGQCPSRLDEPSHIISVLDGLSLRRLLDIQSLTASTQSEKVCTIPR